MQHSAAHITELEFLSKLQRILSEGAFVVSYKYALLFSSFTTVFWLLPSIAFSADYASPFGQWHGQAQFHARVGTELDPESHAVVDMTIAIDPKGKLTSAGASNGCRALGLVGPGLSPRIFNLDVTLSGCIYAGLNRRYSGQIALYPSAMYASFSLQTSVIGLAKKPVSYDVKATLRR